MQPETPRRHLSLATSSKLLSGAISAPAARPLRQRPRDAGRLTSRPGSLRAQIRAAFGSPALALFWAGWLGGSLVTFGLLELAGFSAARGGLF
jgi:hypothetical protein